MDIREKMHAGELYDPADEALAREQTECLEKLYDYNATRSSEGEKRAKMLREMFSEIGEGCYIEPPLHANWAGRHAHFGKNVYANFNLTLVDDTHIYVGDGTMFGPNVVVATAGHPSCPTFAVRRLCSTICPCISAKTAGSARARSSCPGFPSATTPSSVRAAW